MSLGPGDNRQKMYPFFRKWYASGLSCDEHFVMSLANSKKSRDNSQQPKLIDATVPSDDERQPILHETADRSYSYAPNVAYIRRPPKDYKVVAILSAVFCFLPLGIFSIYYSYKVNVYYSRGELTSANRSSERTRLLIQLTVITGCVLWFAGVLALLYLGS